MNFTTQEDPNKKAHDLYYKLHRCLKIALTASVQPNGDDLSIHANHIIVNLARSIESGETWYDASVDIWCGYFLNLYEKTRRVTNDAPNAAQSATVRKPPRGPHL